MRKETDYIIVGQGIAGTVLSYTLLQQGKRVVVIDKGTLSSSSKVAAGIFNPITGKRLAKTWQADLLFPFLQQFYRQMENVLGIQILYLKNIYHPFISIEEQNSWIAKSSSPQLAGYIHTQINHAVYAAGIHNPFGGIEITQAGYVDVVAMLEAYKVYLQQQDIYIEDTFAYQDIRIGKNNVHWNGIQARKILFCEGTYTDNNPYFNWLPYNFVKGELLVVRIKGLQMKQIVNRGIFILPLGEDVYKVGATYQWDDLHPQTTQQARGELTEKLTQLIELPFEIVDHQAGIRPASLDRRPYIGLHPEIEALGIFNGLGTKGISIAPFYARHFYEHLEKGKELEKEAHINRYFPLYYKSKF
jgi:glycine/D-amino acid oxidase-like deaminating enzyme